MAGVAGTIGDQALIDGISRHLRSLEIPVLAPGIYPSFGLEAQLNANNQYVIAASPFLAALQQLADDRVCLQGQIQDLTARINDANEKLKGATTDQQTAKTNAKTAEDNVAKAKTKTDAEKAKAKADADKAQSDLSQANTGIQTNTANLATYKVTLTDVQAIATSIDNYVTSLFGGTSQSKSSQSDSSSKGTDNSGSSPSAQDQGSTQNQSPKQDQGSTQPQSQNIGASNAPINAILAADGVVRRLNYSKDMVDIYRWEILAVKALESGGGVLTKSNLFGSKVYFSGGAVATYALFQMDGSLRCSGNVYDYDGYIREKDFNRAFRRPDISPDKQMIFYRGGAPIWGRRFRHRARARDRIRIPLLQSRIPRRFRNRIQRLYHNRRMALPPSRYNERSSHPAPPSTCFECDDVALCLVGMGPRKSFGSAKKFMLAFGLRVLKCVPLDHMFSKRARIEQCHVRPLDSCFRTRSRS